MKYVFFVKYTGDKGIWPDNRKHKVDKKTKHSGSFDTKRFGVPRSTVNVDVIEKIVKHLHFVRRDVVKRYDVRRAVIDAL